MAYRTAVALALALATASGLAAQSTSTTQTDPQDQTTATGAAKDTAAMQNKPIQGGLSVTGTVVSSEANRLIVKADNGQQMTFIVNESTADPHLFNVGDRVTASYVTLAGTGPVVTKVISTPAETRASTGTVTYQTNPPAASATTSVTPPSASATATVTTPAPAAEVADNDMDNDADNDGIADEDEATTLPATASPLPLIALAGFAAGGAARLIRRFRK